MDKPVANMVVMPVDDLIEELLDAQQDINLAANGNMDQSLCDASALIDKVESALRTLSADNARLREERDAAQRALEHDRTKVIDLVNAVSDEFERRSWLITGRGSYEWDDERFQEEFGAAIDALTPHVQAMRKIGSDWSNCPMTGAEVTAARVDLEARLSEAVEMLKPFAEASANLDDSHPDGSPIWESPAAMGIDAKHLRAAQDFLDSQGGGNG